jgi:hypothetical protein
VNQNAKLFIAAGLLLAAGLALLASPFASGSPDGLDRVAIDKGFDKSATGHPFNDSPVAGYSVRDVENDRVGKGLAGLIGVLLTFGIGLALFATLRLVRASQRPNPAQGQP